MKESLSRYFIFRKYILQHGLLVKKRKWRKWHVLNFSCKISYCSSSSILHFRHGSGGKSRGAPEAMLKPARVANKRQKLFMWKVRWRRRAISSSCRRGDGDRRASWRVDSASRKLNFGVYARAGRGCTRGRENITCGGRLKSRSSPRTVVCRACRFERRTVPRISTTALLSSSFSLRCAIFPHRRGRDACKIMLMRARGIGYWQSRVRPRLAGPGIKKFITNR